MISKPILDSHLSSSTSDITNVVFIKHRYTIPAIVMHSNQNNPTQLPIELLHNKKYANMPNPNTRQWLFLLISLCLEQEQQDSNLLKEKHNLGINLAIYIN